MAKNTPHTQEELKSIMSERTPTERPFLDAIRQDRIAKQIEINKLRQEYLEKNNLLEQELRKMRNLEMEVETHADLAESIAVYIREKANDPKA